MIRHVALQQSDTLRAKFMAEVSIYDPSGWMRVGAIKGTASVNMAIAFVEFVQLSEDSS